jgi:hypothetical protein
MLTSDVVARGIIAAAQAYGDDPVKACTSRGGAQRRCLIPAVDAIAQVSGFAPTRLRKILGMSTGGTPAGRRERDARFVKAREAAVRAVEFAFWRPEAAESVVAATASTVIESAPPADVIPGPPIAVEDRDRRQALGGPITSGVRSVGRLSAKPEVTPLPDRILAILNDGPATPRGLSSILGVNEMAVTSTLRQLVHDGAVLDPEDQPAPAATSIRDTPFRLRTNWRAAS